MLSSSVAPALSTAPIQHPPPPTSADSKECDSRNVSRESDPFMTEALPEEVQHADQIAQSGLQSKDELVQRPAARIRSTF